VHAFGDPSPRRAVARPGAPLALSARRPGRPALLLAALCLAAGLAGAPATAQGVDNYEQMFGPVVDVAIDDLVHDPSVYDGRGVRTRGRLEVEGGRGSFAYALRGGFGSVVRLAPFPEVASAFELEAGFRWMGKEMQVTGVFHSGGGVAGGGVPSGAAGMDQPRSAIQFWAWLGPPEKDERAVAKAVKATLEELVTRAGRWDGRVVRVVGKFRGKNVFGDLPAKSERHSGDWVIKDEVYAVWVTGRKPKGDGWELDASLKRDSGKWIEVVGRAETKGGVTYLRALELALVGPPRPAAEAQPPPPPPERPKLPPVVVFSLPLDGEAEVPPNARFAVQFSKDLEEASLKDRVLLRYAGPTRPGDRPFDGLGIAYDGGRRTLVVDPRDVLRRGRTLELVLLPGIVDLDGLPLTARAGKRFEGAADILRFQVAP
jgi:hypothetical protein